MEYKFLSSIHSPDDVKKLNNYELDLLCEEIRDCLVNTVSKNGGHLSSNLGAVELTVAIHKVFNSPNDLIIFDVGHQSYTHKLLTGRYDVFDTLRTENGITGFMNPDESVHDPVATGHSSTSVSSAYGICKAKELQNANGTAVAVIGDGAMTGGMFYEAINNAGAIKNNLIVILNDNKMSISKNVGSLARHLTKVRSSKKYHKMKGKVDTFLTHIPFIGKWLARFVFRFKKMLKNAIYHSNIFEDLGFSYLGPVDGHSLEQLENILNIAKTQNRPSLVHVKTTKGKGYKYAEESPNTYHGVSPFDVDVGADNNTSVTFSNVFGKAICELAEKDEKICAITAAMKEGTGLTDFADTYKNRFFDVGIAEQHAVTFGAGLAVGGMHPVFAVYSSFLQRGFDQIIHDAAIKKVPLTFCIDRAGFVGEDGETHQGLFDVAYLSMIPNVDIYAPSNYKELRFMLKKAVYSKKTSAIRYPRGCEGTYASSFEPTDTDFSVIGYGSTAIITYGRLFDTVLAAIEELENVAVIKLNKLNCIDSRLLNQLKNYDNIFFFEEGIKNGGVGERVGTLLLENGVSCRYKCVAVDGCFVKSATVSSQFSQFSLDKNSIIKTVKGE